jgi:hypothetical protein
MLSNASAHSLSKDTSKCQACPHSLAVASFAGRIDLRVGPYDDGCPQSVHAGADPEAEDLAPAISADSGGDDDGPGQAVIVSARVRWRLRSARR